MLLVHQTRSSASEPSPWIPHRKIPFCQSNLPRIHHPLPSMIDWAARGERRRAAYSLGKISPAGETSIPSGASLLSGIFLPSHVRFNKSKSPFMKHSYSSSITKIQLMVSLQLWENYIHGLAQVEYHRGPDRDLPAWSRATWVRRGAARKRKERLLNR
jgi:hypothetical protein